MNDWSQRLKQLTKIQKSIPVSYTILKSLSEALQEDTKIPQNKIFYQLLKCLPKQIKQLEQYKQLVYKIWLKDYPIKIRQECSEQILKIVTEWIIYFQSQIDRVKGYKQKFKLIKKYIKTNCTNQQMSALIISQIFQDLKQFFDHEFWGFSYFNNEKTNPSININEKNISSNNEKNIGQNYEKAIQVQAQTGKQLIQLLQLLIFRSIQIIQPSDKCQSAYYYFSQKQKFISENLNCLIFTSLNFLLCLNLNQTQQSDLTHLILQFIRSKYCLSNQDRIIHLVRQLMIKTRKSVRYALVGEFMDSYLFLNLFGCQQVIQQLQNIVFYRELIIAQSKIQPNTQKHSLEEIIPRQYFSKIFIKAGSKEKVYFSVEDTQAAMLKFQMDLDEGMDINIKIFHINNTKQILYHQQLKTELRRLQIKLVYTGLYALQFDNCYSWVHGKTIFYNIHVLNRIQSLSDFLKKEQQTSKN